MCNQDGPDGLSLWRAPAADPRPEHRQLAGAADGAEDGAADGVAFGSAGAADGAAAAANGGDMNGHGGPLGGTRATQPVHFGVGLPNRGGDSGGGFGGFGGPGGSGVGVRGFGFGGRNWQLHDEKYVLSGKGVYNPISSQTWLQDLRDYLAGRSADLDNILD